MGAGHGAGGMTGSRAALRRRGDDSAALPALSVVIPCFNEAQNIDEIYRRLSAACAEVAARNYELIFVNDGSVDGTWNALRALAERDGQVVGISLSRNHGHQLALSAGLQAARGARILIIDADLQDPPELLPQMMAKMDSGADVVYGQRRQRQGETRFKTLTAAAFYRLLDRLVEVKIPVDTGDFRLISRRALDVLNAMPEHHRYIRGMVSWIGLRQDAVSYERSPRSAGTTKYPLKKMIRFAADAITGFSTQPLRLASYLGIVSGLGGVLLLAYILIGWMTGKAVEGWTSLMVVVVTLSSAQLFVLGIMGEYIGRLYMEAKRRPLFVIDEIIGGKQTARGEAPSTITSSPEAEPDWTRVAAELDARTAKPRRAKNS
jgi:polyisoprenyl-phosphate glycosyltransferase